ncbi:MAG: hypothetical protein HS110_10580 [Zoogloeaceae bacterium]|nr:hypothetical protein [Zoogloeaceae bacterium]MCK6385265.1 hypothetical protein [Rhodocyclaceae bacterium]
MLGCFRQCRQGVARRLPALAVRPGIGGIVAGGSIASARSRAPAEQD